MIKVSVIIPVYKVEAFLRECVESVLMQTYKYLEVILVDDGSPDNCPALCDGFALQDERVKVIHKTNGGLSDARNAGLKVATGDYVLFLDSDDYWLDTEFVALLIREAEVHPDVDMIQFGRTTYNEKNKKFSQGEVVDIAWVNDQDCIEVLKYLIKGKLFDMSAWSKLIKRELLTSNNILFEKGLLGEDMDWSLQLWLVLTKVRIINVFAYCYRVRPASITASYSIRNVEDYAWILKKWMQIAEDEIESLELRRLFLGYLAFLYPTLLRNFYLIPKRNRKQEYNIVKNLLSVLQYSITTKSDQVEFIYRLVGFRLTCFIFGMYGLITKRGFSGLKLLLA